MTVLAVPDRVVARMLFVTPNPPRADAPPDQLLGFAVLVSGVRCIVQYAILPFGLPLLGLAVGAARGITLVLDVIAVIAAVTSLRRMWAVQHPQRWRYLLIAVGVIVFAGVFIAIDARPGTL
jgi:ABC-type iron transport system FetAB permease component